LLINNRILIIDDEEVITFGFSFFLKEPDVDVDCASTMEDARHLIGANVYDAAIVDLRLSDSIELEGFECIRLLHVLQRTCRIIVLTAYSDNVIKERARMLDVDRFYEKPVAPDLLKVALTEFNIYAGVN
jgi:DNA-binding response OmpR family regulator